MAIKGEVIVIGDMVVDGEQMTGIFVACDKQQLQGNDPIIYREVVIELA